MTRYVPFEGWLRRLTPGGLVLTRPAAGQELRIAGRAGRICFEAF